MSDAIAYSNNMLLVNQGALSRCCCTTSGFIYWEAVPCQSYTTVGEYCENINQCRWHERKYVNVLNVCAGNSVNICECQKLVLPSFSLITNSEDTAEPDAATWQITSNFSNATGTFTSNYFYTSVKHTLTNNIYIKQFNYSDYTYLHQLVDDINNYSPNGQPFIFTLVKLSASGIPNSFWPTTYTTASPDTLDIASEGCAIFLSYNNTLTQPITIIDNHEINAQRIQNRLNELSSLTNNIEVQSDVDNDFNSNAVYYITFTNNLCDGDPQLRLAVSHRLVGATSQPLDPYMEYGVYKDNENWGVHQFGDYSLVPSGAVNCPYDDINQEYKVPDSINGIVQTQCCPQIGTTLGPNQNLFNRSVYGTEFENLENTVYITDGCYKLAPYFFLFGKEGRLLDDPRGEGLTFVLANCNYGSGINECRNDVPCNCVPELFTTSFHKDVPWGPFGSYYSGIEDLPHPAYLPGQLFGSNYMADNLFSGYHYAPSGMCQARGSWTETTGIVLEFNYYKHVPYYTGTEDPNFSDRVKGKISIGSIDAAFTVASGNDGILDTVLVYNTSGKSIQNFLNAVNNLRTASGNCQIFAFCGAASEEVLLNYPANKINNLSSELFDVWNQLQSNNSLYLVSNPERDIFGYSASTIFASVKKYDEMFGFSGIAPNDFNSTLITRNALLPPPCRKVYSLPHSPTYDYPDFAYHQSIRPFWQSMQGCEETIVNISKNNVNFDPSVQSLEAYASGRTLYLIGTSGITTIFSTGITTNHNGSGYTITNFISNLNALSINWHSIPASSYNPIVASSGDVIDFDVYLDDGTWWDGNLPTAPNVGTRTPHNYGFIEPLWDASGVNLFTTPNLSLKTWVRRRCNWSRDGGTNQYDKRLYPCVPPDAGRLEPSIAVDCEGDNIIDGQWLLAYGCASSNCKEEFYIVARRCGCNTVYACPNDGSPSQAIYHPFNRPTSNTDCTKLSTPTLYMCASNLHPSCDIPFLIKVPYQFLCIDGNSDCYYGDCWQDIELGEFCEPGRCPPHSDLPESNIQIGYGLPDWYCIHNDDQYSYMNSGYDGWCQYIDPENITVVTKDEIPRAYPPEAFVMERTSRPFCSTYINALDAGGGPFKYDSLRPIWPWAPAEYIVGEEGNNPGWPCFLDHLSQNPLFAYVRPMVAELNGQDICPDLTCGRADIDCNTRCCGCGFYCKDGGDPCNNDGEIGPVRNCYHTETASTEFNLVNQPFSCCNILLPENCGMPGFCNIGGYGCNQNFAWLACFDGTLNLTITVEFEHTVSNTYRMGFTAPFDICQEVLGGFECCWGPGGIRETTTTYGGCGGTNYFPCCNQQPSCACGPFYGDCQQITQEILPCSTLISEFVTELVPGTTVELIIGCIDCTFGNFSEVTTVNGYTEILDDCGAGTINYSQDITYRLEGDNSIDSACGLSGTIPLGIGQQPGSFVYDGNTCVNWTSDKDGSWLYRDTYTSDLLGNIFIGDTVCDSCNFNNFTNPKTLDYITNFSYGWECGLPGYDSVSASGNIYIP